MSIAGITKQRNNEMVKQGYFYTTILLLAKQEKIHQNFFSPSETGYIYLKKTKKQKKVECGLRESNQQLTRLATVQNLYASNPSDTMSNTQYRWQKQQ